MSEQDLHIILQYLDGSLNEEEKSQVENRLKKDQDFKKLFDEQQQIMLLWKNADEYEQVKNSVKNIIVEEKNKNRFKKFKLFSAAATILLLAGFLFFLNQKMSNKPYKKTLAFSDSTTEMTLKKELPPQYAKVKYVKPSIHLISPGNNKKIDIQDSLIFKWNTQNSGTDTLLIKDIRSGKVVFSKAVDLSQKTLKTKLSLRAGIYSWLFKSTNDSLIFKIN